jgi:hypothetical protein
MKIVFISIVFVLLSACTMPDYDLDTTPEHDGEHWIGGE